MIEVERLARMNKFDYLLIESTGISEPIPVAQTFSFATGDELYDLTQISKPDTMVMWWMPTVRKQKNMG